MMKDHIRRKYILPKSLAWWASVSPLAVGAFIATLPLHGLTDWTLAAQSLVGDRTPSELVQLGLLGIGLRGASE